DPRYLITFEETDGEPAGAYDAVLGLDACVAVLDGVGTIIGCNDAWRRFARLEGGFEGGECVGGEYPSVWGGEIAAGIDAVLRGRSVLSVCEHPGLGREMQRWFRCTVTPVSTQRQQGAVVTHVDITERVVASSAMEAAADGVFLTDREGRILRVNGAFTRITGYAAEEVSGVQARSLVSGRHAQMQWDSVWGQALKGQAWRGETVRKHRDGRLLTLQQTVSPVTGPDGEVSTVAFTLEDITARKQAEWQVLHLASYDALTGLPNRTLFYERLSQALEWAQRRDRRAALLLLDLDQFRDTNDTMGHPAGDALLVAVARRLEGSLSALEKLGRLGGDEFAVVVEDVESREQLAGRAEHILSAFSEPFAVGGQAVSITASLGIAVHPEDGQSVADLLRGADIAMYKAKGGARNSFHFYDAETDRETSNRVRLVRDLRAAFQNGSLRMAFQPQVDLKSGRLVAAEALIRWTHAEMGEVSAARLVHIAEASGLIHALGDWVLEAVCGHIAAWKADGLAVVPVAVNLSAMQLAGDRTVESLLAPVARHGLTPSQVMAEITESALLQHSECVRQTLYALSNAGVALVLDDFGTGYSSLSYLRQYPVNTIKVDLSFVHGVGTNTGDEEIITAILGLARALGIRVVAEGVETAEQVEFLRSRGCDAAQGYFFGRPMGAEEFGSLLRARNGSARAAGAG
ncbi:MAG: EAL domain-containing protein, partial [Bryobacteraceae bacterium]|nr:EAL domain-containing protein [Bryobacteraceae bacterium]